MKKKWIAAALALVLALSGCAASGNHFGQNSQPEPDFDANVQQNTGGSLKLLIAAEHEGNGNFAAQNGIYQCTSAHNQYWLCYVDRTTHQKQLLCTRDGCSHEDESCEAWLPNWQDPFVVGNHLYLRCMPEWTEEGPGNYYIEQRELDGSGAKKLWEAGVGESIISAVLTDGTDLYFFTYQMETQQEPSAICWNRMSLADGARQRIAVLGNTENYDVLGAMENKAVLQKQTETGAEFYLCDPATFALTQVLSIQSERGEFCFDGGKLYYLEPAEDLLKVIDLATGGQVGAVSDLGLKNASSAKFQAVVEERYVLIFTMSLIEGQEGLNLAFYAVDLEQQTSRKLDFSYEKLPGVNEPYQLLAVFPDGELLVQTGCREIFEKDEIAKVGLDNAIEATIPAEDFFAGKDNFTEIDPGTLN